MLFCFMGVCTYVHMPDDLGVDLLESRQICFFESAVRLELENEFIYILPFSQEDKLEMN